eukprot:CAMPEP_0184976240 /NCGR_PEP_ID=MMETSP1098-20130426/7248_1 /TAXON_ID=89044 /ORGANISM="Spumella elongata, Strain CCAP 955/1" /LENGTH=67 /DNA_ID=CAMNT_0027499077 /DNA_START=24 /DNA_END=224 /DNA_ORIENTATION=+
MRIVALAQIVRDHGGGAEQGLVDSLRWDGHCVSGTLLHTSGEWLDLLELTLWGTLAPVAVLEREVPG